MGFTNPIRLLIVVWKHQHAPWQHATVTVCCSQAPSRLCSFLGLKFSPSTLTDCSSWFPCWLASRCPSRLGNVLWGRLRMFSLLQFSHQKHEAQAIPTSRSAHFQNSEILASQECIFLKAALSELPQHTVKENMENTPGI